MWETWIHDAMTGAPIERVHPAEFPWSTSLLGDGEGTATFKVDDAETALPRQRIWDLFTPNAHMIVLRWGTFVAFAGKIDDWDYSRDAGTLAVRSVELANEWWWRLTYGIDAYVNGTLTVTGRTHSGAVAAILNRFMQGGNWPYPIDLPADAPGVFTQTWEFFKKFRISDLIEQIRAQGYEVYLRPYLTPAGWLRFQTRVAPKVTLGTSSFILQTEESPLKQVKYRLDGSQQLTGLQGVGNGTGQDQEVAGAGAPPYTIPIRDAKREFPDLTGARLQAATSATMSAEAVPLPQWSVGGFQLGEDWQPEHAAPGRVWQIDTTGDPVIPDGTHALRVIGVSGTLGTTLTTEVQSAA